MNIILIHNMYVLNLLRNHFISLEINTKNNWEKNKNILLHILYLFVTCVNHIILSIINIGHVMGIKKRIIELSILNKFINFRFLFISNLQIFKYSNIIISFKFFSRIFTKIYRFVYDTFFVSFYSSVGILLSLPLL